MKAMTTLKFMKKKNKILKKITGITLIPKDQLVEVEAKPLTLGRPESICPYCILFIKSYECEDCPMAIKNNRCSDQRNTDSYEQMVYHYGLAKKLDDSLIADFWKLPKLVKLVRKFNKQFEGEI